MSSAPTGSSAPSWARIAEAIRRASGTPRRWMPTRTRPSVPACFSTISWEIRTTARRTSSAVMIRRAVMRARTIGRGVGARGARVAPSGLSGPDPALMAGLEGWAQSIARSVDLDGHRRRAGPPAAAADREEIGLVHIDDPPGRLRGTVVGDDPLDAARSTADDDRRPPRHVPHRGGPEAVERGSAGHRRLGRLPAGAGGDPGEGDLGARPERHEPVAALDERRVPGELGRRNEGSVTLGQGPEGSIALRREDDLSEGCRIDRANGGWLVGPHEPWQRAERKDSGERCLCDRPAGSHLAGLYPRRSPAGQSAPRSAVPPGSGISPPQRMMTSCPPGAVSIFPNVRPVHASTLTMLSWPSWPGGWTHPSRPCSSEKPRSAGSLDSGSASTTVRLGRSRTSSRSWPTDASAVSAGPTPGSPPSRSERGSEATDGPAA